MKRLHVHVSVNDLAESIRFYSTLFAAEPTVVKDDYAKWMLDDPRVNFAISKLCARAAGISHLGIQAENETELAEAYGRLARAERPVVEAKGTTCCYARSDKQWIADPQGVPWEVFYSYGEAEEYGEGSPARLREAEERAACGCEPAPRRTPQSGAPRASVVCRPVCELRKAIRFGCPIHFRASYRGAAPAAVASVVGVLVEVPVMFSVVRIVLRTRDWYQQRALSVGA